MTPVRRFRLSDMELDFVSLVPRGDDPLARVVIAKADPDDKNHHGTEGSSTLSRNDPLEDGMGEQITKDDLPAEVVTYIDGLEGEVDTLSAQVQKNETDIEALKQTLVEKDERIAKMVPRDAEADGDISKALLEKADPALRELIQKQESAVREAQAIAKAERDARLDREFVAKAEQMPMLTEDKSNLGKLLRRISDALTDEEAEQVEKILRAANEQIAKSSLFDTFGSGGSVTTVSKSVEAQASELMKAHPDWTKDQAEAEVYSRNPDLFREAMTTGQEG